MDLNLNQLRAFHAVARTGAFSKAAEVLFVTEPAVFIQVRSLERYLGFKLFDKSEKTVRLTEVGRMLFSYSEQIFDLVDEAGQAIKDMGALKNGELRLGSARALAHYLMPAVVSSFRDSYPHIKVLLSENNSDQLVKGVLNYQFELAIVARVPYPDRINVIPFTKDRVVVVVSPESMFLRKNQIALDDLNDQPVICRNQGSATRLAMLSAFERQGLKPHGVIESDNTEFIKDMVKQGRGYSFLSSICVRKELEAGELGAVNVKGTEVILDIDVIHLKGKTLSPAATTFLRFLDGNRDLEDIVGMATRIAERTESACLLKAAGADQ